MRRSSIWFVIAVLWFVDTLLRVMRGNVRQAWLPAAITLIFIIVGLIYRRRESRRWREERTRL
jgi:uncharacterized membrane protein